MIDESRVSATHAELSALGLNTYLIRINLISSSLVCVIFVKDPNFRSFFSKNDV